MTIRIVNGKKGQQTKATVDDTDDKKIKGNGQDDALTQKADKFRQQAKFDHLPSEVRVEGEIQQQTKADIQQILVSEGKVYRYTSLQTWRSNADTIHQNLTQKGGSIKEQGGGNEERDLTSNTNTSLK